MTSAKKNKIRLSLFVSFSLYTILSFVISAPHLSDFSSTIDAILYYGAAERFAKVAANAIIANVQAHGSNDNQFFIDTARGMMDSNTR